MAAGQPRAAPGDVERQPSRSGDEKNLKLFNRFSHRQQLANFIFFEVTNHGLVISYCFSRWAWSITSAHFLISV
jgi:hypothetical protein